MDFSVIIPARLEATRLPNKLLLEIEDKPLLLHVIERAVISKPKFLAVATDSEQIAKMVKQAGHEVIMTGACNNGTQRVAEACQKIKLAGVVVNLQGDLPEIDPKLIADLGQKASQDECDCATAAAKISAEEAQDPNLVKVVMDKKSQAMYFSRASIPYALNGTSVQHYGHLGIYAFAAGKIAKVSSMEASPTFSSESLEQLAWMDNGCNISIVETNSFVHGIDTSQDLEDFKKRVKSQ